MISVRFDISVARTQPGDPVLDVAMWLGMALQQEPMDGMVIHNVTVEQGDA